MNNLESIQPIKVTVIMQPILKTQIEYSIIEGKTRVIKYVEFRGKYLGSMREYVLKELLQNLLQHKQNIRIVEEV